MGGWIYATVPDLTKSERAMDQEAKVVEWFNAVDWIQAGSRIAAILPA